MACSRLFGVLVAALSVVFCCSSLACVSASAFASASASASVSVSASDRAALAASMLEVQSQVSHLTASIVNAAHMGVSSVRSSISAVSSLKPVTLAQSQSQLHSQSHTGFHSLAQPSATCVSAVLQLNATANSANCQTYLSLFNSNTFNNPTAALATQVNTMCQSTCLQLLANASATVALQCQSTDAAAFTQDISQTIALSNLLCTKDANNANNYCLVEFLNSIPSLQSTSSITAASLQAFCSPCTFTILNGLVGYGGLDSHSARNISAISTICSIDPVTNQYCLVEFFAAAQALKNNPSQITNAIIEPLCSPCARKFLDAATTTAFDAYCQMNGNDFCIVKDYNAAQQLASSLSGQSSMSQVCSVLSNFAGNVGCCLSALVNAASSSSSSSSSSGIGFSTLLSNCGISIPAQCAAASYTGTFTFVINNLAFAYYQANSDAVKAVIASDIAMNVGVPVSAVTVTNVVSFMSNGQTTGVQVTVTVSFTSSLQSATAVGLFNSNSQSSNFPLTSVAQLGASARIVPFSPVAVSNSNTQASSNAPAYSSKAHQQAPLSSGILIAAAFIAFLYNLNN